MIRIVALLTLVCVSPCIVRPAQAQAACLALSSRVIGDRDLTDGDARGEVEVTLTLNHIGEAAGFELGTSQPIFTFNRSALEYFAADFEGTLVGAGTNASGEPYSFSSRTVTQFGNEISVNLALAGSGAGPDVPATPAVLARVYFKIDDPSASTKLAFEERVTEIFQSDNVTQVPNAQITFLGEDAFLPVELTGFTASLDGPGRGVLEWTTASERGNSGFEVEHTFAPAREAVVTTRTGHGGLHEEASDLVVGHGFEARGFVEGKGTTTEAQAYTFTVADMKPGLHRFRLKQVDYDGGFTYSSEVELEVGPVLAFGLTPNYPNPFSGHTTLRFGVKQTGPARVVLYDMLGRLVDRVFEGEAEAGKVYRVELAGQRLASGQYVVVLTSGGERATQTITRIR